MLTTSSWFPSVAIYVPWLIYGEVCKAAIERRQSSIRRAGVVSPGIVQRCAVVGHNTGIQDASYNLYDHQYSTSVLVVKSDRIARYPGREERITVNVDRDEAQTTFLVHEPLLCHFSDYFNTALKPHYFKEAEERRFDLL